MWPPGWRRGGAGGAAGCGRVIPTFRKISLHIRRQWSELHGRPNVLMFRPRRCFSTRSINGATARRRLRLPRHPRVFAAWKPAQRFEGQLAANINRLRRAAPSPIKQRVRSADAGRGRRLSVRVNLGEHTDSLRRVGPSGFLGLLQERRAATWIARLELTRFVEPGRLVLISLPGQFQIGLA